jgi:hypothetical protein
VSPGQYEINLGQISMGSGIKTWNLTLENHGAFEIPFHVGAVSTADDSWLVRERNIKRNRWERERETDACRV